MNRPSDNPIRRRSLWSRAIALALMLCLGVGVSNLRSDDTSKSTKVNDVERLVASLIEQLGSENFRVRSNAMAMLEKIGLPAFQQLRQSLEHPSAQIALSARYLLLSQNVAWWLDTDSHEVREKLQDYGSLSLVERDTRLHDLASIGSDDALQALCRIAKFEANELISRSAALLLLNKVCKLDREPQNAIAQAIQLAIDTTDRNATEWLATYAKQTLSGDAIDFSVWSGFAEQLFQELPSNGKARHEHQLQLRKFYELLTHWAGDQLEREKLLELLQPSLQLVEPRPFSIREYSNWALSAKLPELVVKIAEVHSSLVSEDAELSYLLAESYLRAGDKEQAEKTATEARLLSATRAGLAGPLGRRGASGEFEVDQRIAQAKRLRERGLFDWAEAECLTALELDSQARHGVRMLLAMLYWEASQFARAADTLQPIVETEPVDSNLPGVYYDQAEVVALYHWYRAMEASEGHLHDAAMEHFHKAIESNRSSQSPNPDILIALYSHATEEADRELFRREFDTMVGYYRSLIASEDARLAQSNLGQFANVSSDLANYCNQLAWLLSNCETNIEEALYLSRRALEYYPDYAAYLDTMARCCFAAERFEDAIRFQRKAVEKSPHDRMMQQQLEQFEAAKSS